MQIIQFIQGYCARRDLAPASKVQLEFAARSLERHLGKSPCLCDLSQDLLNQWIDARLLDGLSRIHVNRQRCALLTIWRAAHADELIGPVPQNVRVVKLRLPPPVAWWPDEFAVILATIETMPGAFMCGVPKRLFMKAFALVAYYSGLRPSDVRGLRTTDIAADGRLVCMVQKTGLIFDCNLPADALEAIAKTRPQGRDLLFPISRKNLCTVWRDIAKLSKIKGTPKFLRRTGATRCEQQQPGSAKSFLGHATDGLAAKHYLDPRQLRSDRPVPPPLNPPPGGNP